MKVLITGGAGFIGSFIIEECLQKGWDPIIVDDFSSGKKEFIPYGVLYYDCDIRNPSLENIFRVHRPEVVIHQAAQVSVAFSTKDPLKDCDVNTIGTLALLQLSVKYEVAKFIFASSAAVYGGATQMPLTESHPFRPQSFYGLSKYTAEQYIQLFNEMFGLDYTILRYSNVYGMRQNILGEAGVVAIFINNMIAGKPLIVYGDGNQTRDFIFVRDIAKANVQAVVRKGGVYNLSSGTPISLKMLIAELERVGGHLPIKYEIARMGDIRESSLSNEKAKKLLGWEPVTGFSSGIRETIEYYEDKAGGRKWGSS